jgi:hypothetical protein
MNGEKRVVDYKVIYERTVEALEQSVKGEMLLGWEPLGGVVGYTSAGPDGTPGHQLLQAMVRRQ